MYIGPSQNQQAWQEALYKGNNDLLLNLSKTEPPGVTYFQIATYINGLYRMSSGPFVAIENVKSQIQRVLPLLKNLRKEMGWKQRDLDIGLLRMIRRSSALSFVIGAGVTIAAGGPSWPELVQVLLETALEKGHEISRMVPTPDSTPDHIQARREVVKVERFKPEYEKKAKKVLKSIKKKKFDTELLMEGAQLCYDLFGQFLFQHLTQIIYSRASKPSEIHKAIADLSYGQMVPERGPGIFPGVESIINYNFDDLMESALKEIQIPYVAWLMDNSEVKTIYNQLAKNNNWHVPIYHLHGYTPQDLFQITNINFIFSTAQYYQVYSGQKTGLIEEVLKRYLANPVHIALYVGCSFTDQSMNRMLREAENQYPGRFHFAILKLPEDLIGKIPTIDQLESISIPYYEMGVYPIWTQSFDEIPDIIHSLS